MSWSLRTTPVRNGPLVVKLRQLSSCSVFLPAVQRIFLSAEYLFVRAASPQKAIAGLIISVVSDSRQF